MWLIRIIKNYIDSRKLQKKREERLTKEVAELLSGEREHCIICRCDTGFRRSQDIKDRKYFVTGVGQLCPDCWQELCDDNRKLWRQAVWEME